MQFIEKQVAFKAHDDDHVLVKHSQEIPDWFLTDLADERSFSDTHRMEDMCRVAVIPEELADAWRRQGFDVFKESAQDIVARLKAEDFGKFLTTNKRI